MIGYLCAYARYYYPKEFVASYLNNAANADDVKDGTLLANQYGIKIHNPRFGYSIDRYHIVGDDIYKGIGSVKFINNEFALGLKELYDSFNGDKPELLELFELISKIKGCNTRNMSILIKIGYFSDYGLGRSLIRKYNTWIQYKDAKKLSKAKLSDDIIELIDEIIYSNECEGFKETPKQYTVNGLYLANKICATIAESDFTQYEKISNELSYLSYVQSELEYGMVGKVEAVSKYGSLNISPVYGDCGGWMGNLTDIKFKKGDYIYISSIEEYKNKKGETRKRIAGAIGIILDIGDDK